MVADMGYANVLNQADVLDHLTAMSTTSGGSWFSTQLFTSSEFFQSSIHSNPTQLASFVTHWMESYVSMQSAIPAQQLCQITDWFEAIFGPKLGDVNMTQICDIYVYFQGDWASFIRAMLRATSEGYGDIGFADRSANAQNFVPQLSKVDLLIQMSLAPNSKVRNTSAISYLSPGGKSDDVISVPLGALYAVSSDGSTSFHLASTGSQEGHTLSAILGSAPEKFVLKDYDGFYLYPNTNGSIVVTVADVVNPGSDFQVPFGGAPTVTQIAAASSASDGGYAGTVPSVLAQTLSIMQAKLQGSNSVVNFAVDEIVDRIGQELYSNPLFQNLAVCSAWPNTCTESDGRLLDGSYSDGPSVAMNIGRYQSSDNRSKFNTIKMIVADHKTTEENNVHLLSYFSTTFNKGVNPGDFIWLPSTTSDPAQNTPVQSPQIFQEYIDESTFESSFHPINGINVTYAILNATTIDNPAFGVVSGQPVELLVLHTNSDIPTALLGADLTTAYIEPLATMAESIASSMELVHVIKSFVGAR
jgi:hypothetical protein